MRTSSVVAASAALVAGANAWGNVTYTTEVVTAYTTFCPSSTELVHGTKTYTVTEATTLVITDCPCTLTKPVFTKPVVPVTTPAAVVTTPVYSSVVVSSIPVVSVPVPIGTAPAGSASVPAVPVGTGVPSVPSQGPLSPPIFYNSTVAVPPAGTGTAAPPAGSASSTGQLPAFTGAANKAFAASGAGLLSVLVLFAYIL